MPTSTKGHEVSPNNPCPFLRALVSAGTLPDDVASLGEVTDVITRVAKTGDGQPNLPGAAIRAIAAAANGLNPLQMAWRYQRWTVATNTSSEDSSTSRLVTTRASITKSRLHG